MELTAAEPRRKGFTQLYLDGEAAVKIDTEVFLRSRLKPGDEISDEELHELLKASDTRRAQEKALYLLEYRSHSKKELTEKIARTAASREAAREAADRMEELGLIDDEAFAREYARTLFQNKGFGRRRVRSELAQKGIREDVISGLLEEYGEEELEEENIRTLLQKKYPLWREDEKIRRRAIGALQRRGFSFGEIRRAMELSEEDE